MQGGVLANATVKRELFKQIRCSCLWTHTLLVVRKRASWNIPGRRQTAVGTMWQDGFKPKADIGNSCRWVSLKQRTEVFASHLQKSGWSEAPAFTGNKISFSSVSDAVELWKILHKERSGLILPCLLILLVSVRTVSYPPVNYFLFSKMFLFKIQFVWISHVKNITGIIIKLFTWSLRWKPHTIQILFILATREASLGSAVKLRSTKRKVSSGMRQVIEPYKRHLKCIVLTIRLC